jgi:hypothetical protein
MHRGLDGVKATPRSRLPERFSGKVQRNEG